MFKVLVDGCQPKRATKYSAAVDLFSAGDIVVGAGETVKVRLGICIDEDGLRRASDLELISEIGYDNTMFQDNSSRGLENFSKSHYLQLEPRSSLRAKGLIAGTGIIDLDYKDEIMIILHNPQNIELTELTDKSQMWVKQKQTDYKINKGEKIAQIMLCEHKSYLLGYKSEEERQGGFGSTGK